MYAALTLRALLEQHAEIGFELRRRGVARTANNPTGDLAEYLFCKAFGWTQAPNSAKGYDAAGPDGTRYQIKGRRINSKDTTRQLSAIRGLEAEHFQFLAGVLFGERYELLRAALIPYSVIVALARRQPHTNSHQFMLRDSVWDIEGVQDITAELEAVYR